MSELSSYAFIGDYNKWVNDIFFEQYLYCNFEDSGKLIKHFGMKYWIISKTLMKNELDRVTDKT